jgi:hypothetical protein
MVKSVAKKVAWVGRTASMVFGLALVLALVFGMASTAFGANGGNFILGSLNNSATAITKLTGTVGGNPALRVSNPSTATGSTALDLQVATGKPPMKVNSTTKVANLNADQLDGKDSTAFLASNGVRADGSHSSAFIDDFTGFDVAIASKAFTAPSAGVLMLTGSISAEDDCNLSGLGLLGYNLRVDGTNVYSSGVYALGYPQDCSVGGNFFDSGAATAVVPVGAGSHTVDLTASEFGTGSFIDGHGISAVFAPNGSGTPIPAGPVGVAPSENPNHK